MSSKKSAHVADLIKKSHIACMLVFGAQISSISCCSDHSCDVGGGEVERSTKMAARIMGKFSATKC